MSLDLYQDIQKKIVDLYFEVNELFRLSQTLRIPHIAHIIQLEKLVQMRDRFDSIHVETFQYPLASADIQIGMFPVLWTAIIHSNEP
tara:strand:+ start:338 stop:598 length:261 start_codon:yes stop_codon:yes gene_type:complete